LEEDAIAAENELLSYTVTIDMDTSSNEENEDAEDEEAVSKEPSVKDVVD
jgi:hypothetical protein